MINGAIVTALGSLVDNRVYPDILPQGLSFADGPCIRYSFAAITPDNTICGAAHLGDEYRIQFDIFALKYQEVSDLRDAIIAAMESTFIYSNDRQTDFSGYEADARVYRWTLQYISNEQ